MALVYRSTVGRRLTVSEGDGNISALGQASTTVFLQSGSAVSETVEAALRRLGKTPQSYGAVGDGVADDTSALNVWLANGGRLYVPAGTYKYTAALTPVSNSEIYGDGDATLFQGAANVKGFNISGKSNIHLHDFKIDGAKATYTNANNDAVKIDWTTIAGSNFKATRLTIRNAAGSGILGLAAVGTPSSGFVVENCDVQDTGTVSIQTQDYISDVVIRGNIAKNSGLLIADRPGITASRNGSNIIVSDNICIGSASALGSSVHGISLDTSTNVTCTGNVCTGWLGFGIEIGFVNGGVVSGNTCVGNTRGGIVGGGIEASLNRNINVSVTGNTCNGSVTNPGIYFYMTGATGAYLHQRIVISGNVCSQNLGSSTGQGILASYIDGLTISGNSCYGNELAGIYALDNVNLFLDGNNVYNNNLAALKTVVSITLSGSTATATVTGHGYSTSDVITIWGANPAEYGGTFTITVTGDDTFTYTTTAGLTTPAVGTIQCSKINSAAYAGVRVQYSLVTTKNLWSAGTNRVYGNGFREWYDVSLNSVVGLFNDALFLKESRQLRVENLTSGESANIRDRTGIFMKNDKIVFAYNNAGTINYLSCALDGSTVTWVNSATTP